MADMKIPGSLPTPVGRPVAGARAEAVRAAHRAFFQAATSESQPAPAAKPAVTGDAASAKPAAEAQRYLRPGSRLDIKV